MLRPNIQRVVIRKNDAASSMICGERPVVARGAASGVVWGTDERGATCHLI